MLWSKDPGGKTTSPTKADYRSTSSVILWGGGTIFFGDCFVY